MNAEIQMPKTVRELGEMAESRGMNAATTLPPAGFTPNYFDDAEHDLVDYSGPDIERPGYKIMSSWQPGKGLSLYIDHKDHEAFTVAEIRDLIATLTGALKDMEADA